MPQSFNGRKNPGKQPVSTRRTKFSDFHTHQCSFRELLFQLFLYLIVMFLQTEQIRMSLFLGLGGINVAFQTQITASLWISNPNNLQTWKHLN